MTLKEKVTQLEELLDEVIKNQNQLITNIATMQKTDQESWKSLGKRLDNDIKYIKKRIDQHWDIIKPRPKRQWSWQQRRYER